MRNRILFAAGGAVFGVLLSAPLQDSLKLSPGFATGAAAVIGVVIGLFASILFDVFTLKPEQPEEHPEI